MSFKLSLKSELISVAYGCLVQQVVEECGNNVASANSELDSLGFSIGGRLVDEFLFKQDAEPCKNFKDAVDKTARGLLAFLGIDARVAQHADNEFSFLFADNSLDRNAIVPAELEGLEYSSMICGAVRGALNAVNFKVKCWFVSDRVLRERTATQAGPAQYEVRVALVEVIKKKLVNYDD